MLEHFERTFARRAVDAQPGDVEDPAREPATEHVRSALVRARREEVVLHVLHAGLDFALLFRASWRGRRDLEAVVSRQLPVAAIQRRWLARRERCANHRRLQIVGHDDGGHSAEVLEGLHVQQQPGLDLLVEADARELMARVAQHHHEHVRLAKTPFFGVVELADIAEVHLRLLPGLGLQRDRDVFRTHAARATNGAAQSLDRGHAAVELRVLLTEPVVDRLRARPLAHQRLDQAAVPLDAAALLRGRARNRALRLHGTTQLIERRQRVHRTVPQARRDQRLPIHALGVGAHAEQRRRRATTRPHPMQTNELL